MDTTELHRLCGLTDLSRPKRKPNWTPVELRFIGADGYLLRVEHIQAEFRGKGDGLALTTKHKLVYPAAKLMGKKCKVAKLYDVLVVTDLLTLSLASLMPEMYPMVLRIDDEVTIL